MMRPQKYVYLGEDDEECAPLLDPGGRARRHPDRRSGAGLGSHWEWHGERHIWIPGRYEVRPEHSHWEHHRWERMNDGQYRFNRGHWRRD